jgi:hypothetical protein
MCKSLSLLSSRPKAVRCARHCILPQKSSSGECIQANEFAWVHSFAVLIAASAKKCIASFLRLAVDKVYVEL